MTLGGSLGKARLGRGPAGRLLVAILGRPAMPGFPRPDTFVALGLVLALVILGALGQLSGAAGTATARPFGPSVYPRVALAGDLVAGCEIAAMVPSWLLEPEASLLQDVPQVAPAPLWPGFEDQRVFASLVEGDPGRPRGDVRAVYLTGASAADPAFMQRVFELVKTSVLNALVIDVKDNSGRTTYASQLPEVLAVGGSWGQIKDLGALLLECEKHGVYTIGRLVTFADPVLAGARLDLAIQNPWGGVWRDHTGHGWTNPYSADVWEYNLAIAREVAALGCREIQFDYVRFPSDGNLDLIRYPVKTDQRPAEVIESFLREAKEALSPYGAFVAADVFGLVTSFTSDMRIGQLLENVARQVDFVCPMMYPSHYATGNYGLPDPDAEPYLTIRAGLTDALRRLPGQQVQLRPWLQDFSWGHKYGVPEVTAQIRAAGELGVNGFMLWNPRNVYTEGAVRQPVF